MVWGHQKLSVAHVDIDGDEAQTLTYHKPAHPEEWSRGRENGHGAGRGGLGSLPPRGCRSCCRAGVVVGRWTRAARDAGGLWDTNPFTSLSAGALT